MEIEIGRAKRARRAYTFDDIAVVPSRRTRNPEDVSTAWTIDAFQFAIPVLGAPMDSVVSPTTAIMLGSARRTRRARPRGRSGPATTTPSRYLAEIASLETRCHPADAGAVRRADQARAGARSAGRDPRRRRHGGRRTHAAAHAGALRDGRRRRRRPLRDPRHDGVGRARLQRRDAAEPQEVHLRPRRARHRRRRRRPTPRPFT